MPDEERDLTLTEKQKVYNWRLESALKLGLAIEPAEEFAGGDGDLERLRVLILKRGWEPHKAAKVA